MKTYTIYEAKTQLSDLVKRAARGETIRIGAHGKAAVELRGLPDVKEQKPESFYGIWKGKVWYSPDYDQADEAITDAVMVRIQR